MCSRLRQRCIVSVARWRLVSFAGSDLPDERIADLLDKQVNRYQAIVARLANNSVQVKTWCVTAVGAISAIAVNNHRAGLFGVALAILGLFMALDVQYLWLERRFRDASHTLVQHVATDEVGNLRDFFSSHPPPRSQRGTVADVIKSFT